MKIKGQLKDTEFKDLTQSEAFIFQGKAYLKIQQNESGENAANIETGHLKTVSPGDRVIAKPKAYIDLGD